MVCQRGGIVAQAYLVIPSQVSLSRTKQPHNPIYRLTKPRLEHARRKRTWSRQHILASTQPNNENFSNDDNDNDDEAKANIQNSNINDTATSSVLPSYRRLISYILATVLLWSCESVQSLIDTTAVAAQQHVERRQVLLQVAALSPATTLCDFLIYLTYFLAMATTHQLSHALAGATTTQLTEEQSNNNDHTTTTNMAYSTQGAPPANYYQRLRRITSNVLGVAALCGVVMTIFVWIWGEPCLQRMVKQSSNAVTTTTAQDATLLVKYATQYTYIRATALTAAILSLTGQAVCLVTFQTPTAVRAMFTAFGVNALGNIILTRLWGLPGAAWATVGASWTSCGILLRAIQRQMREWKELEQTQQRQMEQSNVAPASSPQGDSPTTTEIAEGITSREEDAFSQFDIIGPSAMEQVQLQKTSQPDASSATREEENNSVILNQLRTRRQEINQEHEQGERPKTAHLSRENKKSTKSKKKRLRHLPYVLDVKALDEDKADDSGEKLEADENTNEAALANEDESNVSKSASLSTTNGQLRPPPLLQNETKAPTATTITWLSLFSIPSRREFQTLVRLAGPLSLINLAVIASYAAMTISASEFGVAALAAHNVLESCFFLFGCFGDAIAQATQAFLPAAARASHQELSSLSLTTGTRTNQRGQQPSLYNRLWQRLLIVTTVVGFLNSQLSQVILSLFGRYLMAGDSGVVRNSPTLLSMVAPASFGYLRLALLVHPFVLLLEGSILSFGQIRALLVCYGLTISVLGALLQWTCSTFDHIWRSLFWFQAFRFVCFAMVRLTASTKTASNEDVTMESGGELG